MKKFPFALAAAFLPALVLLNACHPDDPDSRIPAHGAYVLNNGSWGGNNASISLYDPATKELAADAFLAANGSPLGELGQDLLLYGDELYIAVNGSQVVFVTDLDLQIKKTITAQAGGSTLSPRYLTSGGGKVYVTYYEGYLGEINPSTYKVRTTAVGPNPEGLCYVDGKIFVANSGGYLYPTYNNTVSVVNASSFTETSTITVNTNPNQMVACGARVYVSSFGDYADIPPMVQYFDASKEEVSDLGCDSPSAIATDGSSLYVLCGGYDENWNPLPGTVLKYNAKTGTKVGNFVTDGTTLPNAYSLSVTEKRVWVGCSDYKSNGDVYVFNAADGKLYDQFGSQGMNPLKVIE